MAAGVIRNLTDFRLAFQHPFYTLTDQQEDMDFQEGSSEEEEEEEGEMEEEEEEGEEKEEGAGDTAAPQHSSHGTTEMTIQLLRFADLINCDIQRYFGKKSKEDPDACEIYEDRLSSVGRSGRERYYADLMRVAQSRGREEEEEEEELPHALRALCSRDSIQQLGPLAELFSVGLRRYVKPGGAEHARRQKGGAQARPGGAHVQAQAAPSFWAEPTPLPPACLLSATNTPDFSDLLANWTCESSQELQGVSSTNSPRQQTLETAHYHIA